MSFLALHNLNSFLKISIPLQTSALFLTVQLHTLHLPKPILFKKKSQFEGRKRNKEGLPFGKEPSISLCLCTSAGND